MLRRPAGIGTSALAHAAGEALAPEGRAVVTLQASAALRAIPFGNVEPPSARTSSWSSTTSPRPTVLTARDGDELPDLGAVVGASAALRLQPSAGLLFPLCKGSRTL